MLHFFWMRAGKNNFSEVFIYAGIVAILLAWRVWDASRKAQLQRQKAATAAPAAARVVRR